MSNAITTYQVTLFIAGDIDVARQALRRECYERGLCVTVTRTTFVFTGGEEGGVAIGFVNYPRFPSTPDEVFARASEVARMLLRELCQRSVLLVATDRSEWLSIEPPGARS